MAALLQNAKAGNLYATNDAQQFRREGPPTSCACGFPSRLRRCGGPSRQTLGAMGWEAKTEEVPLTPEQEKELWAIAVERAPKDLAEAEAAETENDLFCALPHAAMAAWHLQNFERARELANKALELAPSYSENWNYGNAINLGHSVLGLLALREGKIAVAVEELHKAGTTPGSPQLNSFGPSTQLARALARKGEFDATLKYMEQCRSFWKMGAVWLGLWEEKLKLREIPNCMWSGFR